MFPARERLARAWARLVVSRPAPLLTHGGLLLLTATFFALLLRLPFWIAFVPCAIVQHRIGVLLHEYIHGIPFARYRTNLRVLTACDACFLMFGLLDLFRATHLAHHHWLNTEKDPAHGAAHAARHGRLGRLGALEGVQHLVYLVDSFRGRHPYVIPSRIVLGAGLSSACVAFWFAVGLPGVVVKVIVLTLYNTLVPVSLRGAVEHHSHPGDPSFANEYRVLIPLFNLNRHVHHHEDPRCPWYRLEYRTAAPLPAIHYLTHWFRAYLTRDYVLMRPMPAELAVRRRPRALRYHRAP
jgi:fatty acid desaturase